MSNKKKKHRKNKTDWIEEQTENRKTNAGGCLFLTRFNWLYACIINKKQIGTINMSSFSIF